MISDRIAFDLHDVQETLLLPLWGRAVESRKGNPLLVDETAEEVIRRIDYDFTTIAANISLITQLAWIARSIHIDRVAREFLLQHPRGTVVNIGAGLDTTFERVDNGRVVWFDLDLPDVIALRRKFIAEGERRKYIASSFMDESWCSALTVEDSVLFIAAGVFYYFEEAEMRRFLCRLAGMYPGGEVFFDAASPLGLRTANKVVIQAGGMDQSAILRWGMKNAHELQSWDQRIKVLEEYPMFEGMKKRLGLKAKIGTFMADRLRIMSMVHLRFLI